MNESSSLSSGFTSARVVHLHPSRFCNLSCQHCYSASGPNVRDELSPQRIISSLAILRAEEYDVLSFSGGEPLLYSGFEKITRHAVELGFKVNLITNGAPVGGRLLELIAEYVNLVAVSIDGSPETHVSLRGDPQSFFRAERAIDRLASKGVKFGIAYCVSKESLVDMPWSVEFAKSKGATLVQFHPFAATGRGKLLAERLSLEKNDRARAYVIASMLNSCEGPAVHIDLVPAKVAYAQRRDYDALVLEDATSTPLSDLVNPLIIDEYGLVFPFCYGVNQRFTIGKLGPSFFPLIESYKKFRWQELRSLLRITFNELQNCDEDFVDWFYHLVSTSNVFLNNSLSPLLHEEM